MNYSVKVAYSLVVKAFSISCCTYRFLIMVTLKTDKEKTALLTVLSGFFFKFFSSCFRAGSSSSSWLTHMVQVEPASYLLLAQSPLLLAGYMVSYWL